MKRTAALRVTGEICFYFSILTLFPVFRRWELPIAGFALACLFVSLIAVGLRSAPLRVLLALLPAACFLFAAEASWLLVFPGLAWLYFILYLALGRFGIALYDYRRAFRWMLILSAFVLAGQAVNSMLFSGKSLSYASLAFLVAFILLSVIAMRSMQMGAEMDVRWHTANSLTVAVVLLVSVGVSLGLYYLYLHSVPVIVFLFTPLRRFLAWLFRLIRFNAMQQDAPRSTPPPETPTILFKDAPLITGQGAYHIEEPERTVSGHLADQALTVGAFLVLAFLVFMALLIIVKLVRRGKALAAEGMEYEQTEGFTPGRRQRKARPEAVRGPAQSVRELYREYLDYLKENGLERSAADTSEEILAGSACISTASAAAEKDLRRIYLKARYSAAAVTGEDVDEAKRCLDAIRSRETL